MPRGRAAASPAPTEARKRAASKSTARDAKKEKAPTSPAPEPVAAKARSTTPVSVRKRVTKAAAPANDEAATSTAAPEVPAPVAPLQQAAPMVPTPVASAPPASTAGTNELTIFIALLFAIGVVAHQLAGINFLSSNVLALASVGPTLAMGVLLLRTAVAKGALVRESFTTWVLLFVILLSTRDAVKALSNMADDTSTLSTAVATIIVIYDAVCSISLVMAMLNAERIAQSQVISLSVALSVLVGITYVSSASSWDAVAKAYLPMEAPMEVSAWAAKLAVVLGTGAAAIAASRAFGAWLAGRSDVLQHAAAAAALLLLSPTFSAYGVPHVSTMLTNDAQKTLLIPVTQWLAVLLLTYAAA